MSRQSWWVKHHRAVTHVDALAAEISETLATSPSAIMRLGPEGAAEFRVGRFLIVRDHWSAIAGDAIHNMRSALDHVSHGLVLAGRGSPDRQTAFPVVKSASGFARAAKAKLPGVYRTRSQSSRVSSHTIVRVSNLRFFMASM
jgi:hypothetical protein